jgi:hypothetical protein
MSGAVQSVLIIVVIGLGSPAAVPERYVLICNRKGHYVASMARLSMVTGN